MILANFKSWKKLYIFITLVIISAFFALLPPTQESKNRELFHAVAENNVTRSKMALEQGAQRNLLLPTELPLISLAIEYDNEEMVALLLDESIDLKRAYGSGYNIIGHAIEKKNKKIIKRLVDAYEGKAHE